MAKPLRSADVMVQSLLGDHHAMAELKQDPDKVLKAAASRAKIATPLSSDVWVYRMVVFFLGAAVLMVIGAYVVCALQSNTKVPEGLVAIGSAAVGALAGLLAPSPANH